MMYILFHTAEFTMNAATDGSSIASSSTVTMVIATGLPPQHISAEVATTDNKKSPKIAAILDLNSPNAIKRQFL